MHSSISPDDLVRALPLKSFYHVLERVSHFLKLRIKLRPLIQEFFTKIYGFYPEFVDIRKAMQHNLGLASDQQFNRFETKD